MLSVHNLRKMGYKVKVWHDRNYTYDNYGRPLEFESRGGMTEVEVYDMNSQESYIGLSTCSPKDNYCRKMGVKIALGRALKQMGFDVHRMKIEHKGE